MAFIAPALPYITAAAAVAGTVSSISGNLAAGKAAQAEANYRAQVAHNNEIIANQNADYAIKAGQQKAAVESMKGAALVGRARAAAAASGIDVNSGSALDVQESEREKAKLDTETTLSNAQLQAYGYRSQAAGFSGSADLSTLEGGNAEAAGNRGAVGSLFEGATAIAGAAKDFGGGTKTASPWVNPDGNGLSGAQSGFGAGDW